MWRREAVERDDTCAAFRESVRGSATHNPETEDGHFVTHWSRTAENGDFLAAAALSLLVKIAPCGGFWIRYRAADRKRAQPCAVVKQSDIGLC
jgi:hypothetical protein